MFILKEVVEKCLYVDVETASIERDLETLERTNPRLAALWEKRADFYRGTKKYELLNDHDIFREKASLEAEFSKIVCVSFGTFNEGSPDGMKMMSFSGTDEKDILNKTNKVLNNATQKGFTLCGHNIKGFDVPVIGKRMIYNGIEPTGMLKIYGKKPWEVSFVDTSDIFSFGNWGLQRALSLDILTCSLDIPSPKSELDGSKVSEYFWTGRIEEITTYCEADVQATMLVMKKLLFEE